MSETSSFVLKPNDVYVLKLRKYGKIYRRKQDIDHTPITQSNMINHDMINIRFLLVFYMHTHTQLTVLHPILLYVEKRLGECGRGFSAPTRNVQVSAGYPTAQPSYDTI